MVRLVLLGMVIALGLPLQPALAQPLERLDPAELERAIGAGRLGRIVALAAEQGGKTVYRKRFDEGRLGDPVDIRSAGKSITALAVGAAIADGHLAGTDVAVWPYLGHKRGEPFDSITVADLLGMSSALDCNDWDRKSPGQEEKMYRTRAWREFVLALPSRAYSRDEHGSGPFSYCTAGVFLLGQVVEQATQEAFDGYVQRRLFDPLAITGVVWRRSRSGEVQSGGQLTIGDDALLRLGRLVLERGESNGERILPANWIDTILTPRHRMGEHVYYGDLWWFTPIPTPDGYAGAWMMKGNGGNIVAIVPDYDAVLVVQARNYNEDSVERNAFVTLASMLSAMEPRTDRSQD